MNLTKCPICNNKWKITDFNGLKNKSCKTQPNHFFTAYFKDNTLVEIQFSLDPRYTLIISINYEDNNSTLTIKNPKSTKIIPFNYTLPVEFPDLKELKELVNSLVLLS